MTSESLKDSFSALSLRERHAEEVMREVERVLEEGQKVLSWKRPPPDPLPPDLDHYDELPFDPHRTLMSVIQYKMFHYYELGGYRGLLLKVMEDTESNKERYPVERHRYLLGKLMQAASGFRSSLIECLDNESERDYAYTSSLLGCIHEQALLGMLNSNIAIRQRKNEEFDDTVKQYLKVDARPGIYLLETVNNDEHAYPGRCMNWHEWRILLDAMSMYVDAYDTKSTNSHTEPIDNVLLW